MIAHAKVKPQRKQLNNYLIQLAREGVVLILCYRANDKIKPMTAAEKAVAKQSGAEAGLKHVGFVPETTSPLRFEMTVAFLLMPGAKGAPIITPETVDEKIWSKVPMQFEGWNKGEQLSEEMGRRLATWALGGSEPKVNGSGTKEDKSPLGLLRKEIATYKAKVGDDAFYTAMGAHGAERREDITTEKQAGAILAQLKETLEAQQ